MSEQPGQEPDQADLPRPDDTDLAAGAPGPSGTGEQTAAGADPEAPSVRSA